MTKKLVASLVFGLTLGVALYAQTRGTPSQLRVGIDATGALVTVAAAQVLPLSTCTFSNCRLLLDSQGRLVTTVGSGSEVDFESIGGGTSTRIPYFASSGFLAEDANFSWDPVAQKLLVLGGVTGNNGALLVTRKATGGSPVLASAISAYRNSQYNGGTPTAGDRLNSEWLLQASDNNWYAVGGAGGKMTGITSPNIAGGTELYYKPDGATLVDNTLSGAFLNSLARFSVGASFEAAALVHATSIYSSSVPGFIADQYGDNTNVASIVTRKARGTFASPAATANGDPLLQIAGRGYQTTSGAGFTNTVGSISIVANEAFTNTAQGTRMQFFTVPNGSTTEAQRMQLNEFGLRMMSGSGGLTVANVGANSCGTTAATVAGTNNAGRVTVGATSGTQCRVTTTSSVVTAMEGSCSNTTTAALCRFVPVDGNEFDLVGTFTAGDVLSFIVMGR